MPTPAAGDDNLYTNLDTLKLSMKMTDADRDDLLNAAIRAASRSIDSYCGRRFWQDFAVSARTYSTRGRTVRNCDGTLLLVDDIASDADLAVETGDGSTWTDVDVDTLDLGPDNAVARGLAITGLTARTAGWGTRRVRITAYWGWPTVPDEVAQACLIQAARLYRRKDSPEGVVGSAEWGVIRVGRVDPDMQALLQPYVIHGFA